MAHFPGCFLSCFWAPVTEAEFLSSAACPVMIDYTATEQSIDETQALVLWLVSSLEEETLGQLVLVVLL